MRPAASRTFWTAGNKRPINTAMMAMTTNSSIRVKAKRRVMTYAPFHRPAGGRDGAAAAPLGAGSRGYSLHNDVKTVRFLHPHVGREDRLGVGFGIHSVVENDPLFARALDGLCLAAKCFSLPPA